MEVWSSRSPWKQLELVADVFDALEVLGAGPADHAVDAVALGEEQLGQVRAVLAGDAGDESPSAS